jgi:hypothetical protein
VARRQKAPVSLGQELAHGVELSRGVSERDPCSAQAIQRCTECRLGVGVGRRISLGGQLDGGAKNLESCFEQGEIRGRG